MNNFFPLLRPRAFKTDKRIQTLKRARQDEVDWSQSPVQRREIIADGGLVGECKANGEMLLPL